MIETNCTTRLKGGYGYWETVHMPIGGSFRRAGTDGKVIKRTIREFNRFKGCDMEVEFADGSTGAVDSAHVEPIVSADSEIPYLWENRYR